MPPGPTAGTPSHPPPIDGRGLPSDVRAPGSVPAGPGPPSPLDTPFGTNVAVSAKNRSFDDQNEITMAVASDGRIHVGWNDLRFPYPRFRCGYGYSTDGGATWSPGRNLLLPGWNASGDPVVIVDANDVVYFVCLNFAPMVQGNGTRVVVYRSDDGGVTWASPTIASDTVMGINDKPWAHAVGTTIHICYARAVGGNPTQLRYTRSTDGGLSWEPTRLITVGMNGCEFASTPGNLYLGWWTQGGIEVYRSQDDGLTWARYGVGSAFFLEDPTLRALPIPSFAADPISGNVYAVWTNDVFSGNWTWDIAFARSTDRGVTWSQTVLNNVQAGRQFMPWIDVSPDGSVHVAWCDDRSGLMAVYYATSTDGGLSWSASSRVNDVEWSTAYFIGDYIALDVDASGAVHVGWTDRRNGENEAFHARTDAPQPRLARIEVSPAEALMDADTSVLFTAAGFDQFGRPFAISPAWEATGGTIAFGRYTPKSSGDWTVWANESGLSGTAVVHVLPGALVRIEVSPTNATVSADRFVSYEATGFDAQGNVREVAPSWAVANGTIDEAGRFSPHRVGTWTVWANESGVSGSTSVTVTPGALAAIFVSPPAATITADETIQLTATGTDVQGNPVPCSPTWAAANGTIDSEGQFSPWRAGNWTVWANESAASGRAAISVTPGALAAISVAPLNVTITADDTLQFIATGSDRHGNLVAIAPTWSASGGTVDDSGLYDATLAGTWTVTARAQEVSGSSRVDVVPGVLARIEVLPPGATVRADMTLAYAANGSDADGNAFPVAPSWSATAGSIDATGLYTPGPVGVHTVIASSGDVSGFTFVTVLLGPLAQLQVSPSTATITADDRLLLTATGSDARGNPVATAPTWQATCGSVGADGWYTPGPARICLVFANESGLSAVATIRVLPGLLARIDVVPPIGTITADDTVAFTATGYDAKGNELIIAPAWSAEDGSIDSGGVFQPHHVGTWLVAATASGISAIARVVVTAGSLAAIDMLPSAVSITADDIAQFVARGTDAKGNPVVLGTMEWSVPDGSVADGRFEPVHAGEWTITATSGGIRGTAQIIVGPGRVALVVLSPSSVRLVVGQVAAFQAIAYDAKGNVIPNATLTWEVVGSVGTVDAAGRFTAAVRGDGHVYVTATDGVGASSTVATIHVDSTSGPSLPPMFLLLLAVAVLAIIAWARRRRRADARPPAHIHPGRGQGLKPPESPK